MVVYSPRSILSIKQKSPSTNLMLFITLLARLRLLMIFWKSCLPPKRYEKSIFPSTFEDYFSIISIFRPHLNFSHSNFFNSSPSIGLRLSFRSASRKCAISSGKVASRKPFIEASTNFLCRSSVS